MLEHVVDFLVLESLTLDLTDLLVLFLKKCYFDLYIVKIDQ